MKKNLFVLLAAIAVSCAGESLKLNNPSFEFGTSGYWVNRTQCASVDSADSSHGRKSLLITPPEKGTVDLVFPVSYTPDTVWKLKVDAKASGDKPILSVSVLVRDQKPIRFHPMTAEQKKLAAANPVLSDRWQTYTFEIGPVPPRLMNRQVKNLLFYLKVKGSGKKGEIRLDNIRLDPVKKAGTSTPAENASIQFEFPDPVQIYDHALTLPVKANSGKNEILTVSVYDERGTPVSTQKGDPGENTLETNLRDPGYYHLEASILKDGKKKDFRATDVIITEPLPADYYKTPHPAFGVWGGLSPKLRRLGGAKWDRQLFFTTFQKKNAADTPPSAEMIRKREPVKIIRCLNILNPFKRMVPLPKGEWDETKRKLAIEIRSKRGLVDVWETQNEPMVGENFFGTMNDVMDLIKLESEVVRREDPGRPIAGICINPMSQSQYAQYKGYYRNHGISRYVDGVMLHPYIPGAQDPDAAGYAEILNRLQSELRASAGREVPMYISEIGYSTRPGGEVSEFQQAAYLARVMILNFTIPSLKACVWHIGLWNEATSRRELDFSLLRKHPKQSPVRVPKPAFAAWAAASRMLYDAELVGELDFGRSIRVWLFRKSDGSPLLTAYSLTKKPASFKLAVKAKDIRITEVCGARRTEKVSGGLLSLNLTEAPVYIQIPGESVDNFAGNRYNTVFTPEELKIPAGKSSNFTVRLPEAFSGPDHLLVLQSETPVKTSVRRKTGGLWEVELMFPKRTVPGEHELVFRVEKDGVCRFIRQKKAVVQPPLELVSVHHGSDGPDPEIRFFVKQNAPGAKQSAVLEIMDDSGRILSIGRIEADKEGRMRLYNTSYGRKHHFTARFTDAERFRWEMRIPDDILPVRIPYAKDLFGKSPKEWPAGGVYPIEDGNRSLHGITGKFDRPSGLLALAYDETYLYLSADVRDAWFKTFSAASLWNADSLQIGISVEQKHMIRPNNDGIQETAYAEFGIHAGPAPNSWVWASMNLNNMPLHKPVPGIRTENSYGDGTIRYRIALPWKTLNIEPGKGMRLGISITFNDRDENGRHWVEWYGGIAGGKVREQYGEAYLE